MEKEELVEVNEASPQAMEDVEGDAFTVNLEDGDEESEEAATENNGHRAVENLEGDVFKDWDEESEEVKTENNGHSDLNVDSEDGDETSHKVSSQAEGDAFTVHNDEESMEAITQHIDHDGTESDNEHTDVSHKISSQAVEELQGDAFSDQSEDQDENPKEAAAQNIGHDGPKFDNEQENISDNINEATDAELNTYEEMLDNVTGESELAQRIDESTYLQCGTQEENLVHERSSTESEIQQNIVGQEYSGGKVDDTEDFESESIEVNLDDNAGQNGLAEERDCSGSTESTQMKINSDDTPNENNNSDPECDKTVDSRMEVGQSTPTHNLDTHPETPLVVEKAVSLSNFVREKGVVAVSTFLRRLSGKVDEGTAVSKSGQEGKDASESSKHGESKKVPEKTEYKAPWNPLSYLIMSSDADSENKTDQRADSISESPPQHIAMKGRIILYTRLGCQESKEVRRFLYMKRLRYVEINIDVYPGRMKELEKNAGSSSVPKIFFNEILIGGLSELNALNESGRLDEKIEFLINEIPALGAPLPPLSGEDDLSSSGTLDEMALIVRKMKEYIVVKDRFYKLRIVTNCFVGSEAVDFLSQDQVLERKEAVEFGRKLACNLFFRHVLEENLFEDGNHLYRFLDDDPLVAQCQNIPRGISTLKPKSMTDIESRLRVLCYAMFEAYASEDRRHVDYRSIHGSEEFARYLRIVEELQRVEAWHLSREEKLAFFINLYNMMTIHAILVWGHPAGALERRKLFGDFKYVIGGTTYSISAIQNGILRANQRPPYTLMKPFGANDKRSRVAVPYPEPLIHFALVNGTRSGPALWCYSPKNIDKELMDAARNFLKSGGLLVDFTTNVVYASKILHWFSVDFGKNEAEVLKHVSIYLEPTDSTPLLDLLATSELKVMYQPYDWGLNC